MHGVKRVVKRKLIIRRKEILHIRFDRYLDNYLILEKILHN